MTFETDDDKPITGITDHVDRYKQYLTKLKTGRSSGISATFGKASELLPAIPISQGRPALTEPRVHSNKKTVTADVRADLPVRPPLSSVPQTLPPFEFFPEDVGSEPDIRVNAETGMWLWDIYYAGHLPAVVETAEGLLIQRTQVEDVYVMAEPLTTGRFPRLRVLDVVAVDPKTGNIFWQSLHGTTAGAMLNNGWRVEQHHREGQEDAFYALEPMSMDSAERKKFQVFKLELDPIKGEVVFETEDGEIITLQSRLLDL